MSSIDLKDPQVLANHLRAQVKEGKGEFEVRDNVVVFINKDGGETIAPADIAADILGPNKKKRKVTRKSREDKE